MTIDYLRQVHETGIINATQFADLVRAVIEAADSWSPRADKDCLPLEG